MPAPHPRAVSLVGSYVYSYDVAAAHRQPTSNRSIPGMRPSYDAEHPSPATPIYDALYSEYRRLFRALPGDRSGEESMKFTGFAVRDGHPGRAEQHPAHPPQHQAFHTYPGHAQGTPQFMSTQPGDARPSGGQGWVATGYLAPTAGAATAGDGVGAGVGGRHRSGILSLPPGRVPGQA